MTCPRSCNSYSQSWFQKPGPWHQGHFSFCPISLPLLVLSLLWVLEQRACWSRGQCSLNLRPNWCSLWWAQLSFDFSEGNCANPKQLTPVCVPSAHCRASCGSSHVYWAKRWGNEWMRKRRREGSASSPRTKPFWQLLRLGNRSRSSWEKLLVSLDELNLLILKKRLRYKVAGWRPQVHRSRASPGTQVSWGPLFPLALGRDQGQEDLSCLVWASWQVTPASLHLISPNQFAKLPLMLSGNLQAVSSQGTAVTAGITATWGETDINGIIKD